MKKRMAKELRNMRFVIENLKGIEDRLGLEEYLEAAHAVREVWETLDTLMKEIVGGNRHGDRRRKSVSK